MHFALAVVSGGSRMKWDHRRRGAVRIHLAANMSGNFFEERARELIHEFSVEIRATDEQKINADGMQRRRPDPGTFLPGSKVRLSSG